MDEEWWCRVTCHLYLPLKVQVSASRGDEEMSRRLKAVDLALYGRSMVHPFHRLSVGFADFSESARWRLPLKRSRSRDTGGPASIKPIRTPRSLVAFSNGRRTSSNFRGVARARPEVDVYLDDRHYIPGSLVAPTPSTRSIFKVRARPWFAFSRVLTQLFRNTRSCATQGSSSEKIRRGRARHSTTHALTICISPLAVLEHRVIEDRLIDFMFVAWKATLFTSRSCMIIACLVYQSGYPIFQARDKRN